LEPTSGLALALVCPTNQKQQIMETQLKERQAGYYKIINAEKQYQDGVATGLYWITDASRVLVSEEGYLEHLRMQH